VFFVLLEVIDVVLRLWLGGVPDLLLYPRGKGYKKNDMAEYNYNTNRTLSLVLSIYKIRSD
jgi:hypothetical protein